MEFKVRARAFGGELRAADKGSIELQEGEGVPADTLHEDRVEVYRKLEGRVRVAHRGGQVRERRT